jgi:hypothetical protein
VGVEFYLYDERRKELFILGKGSWHEVFFSYDVERGDDVLKRLSGLSRNDVTFLLSIPELAPFLQAVDRRVELGSDAADIGSVAVPYRICGSRYADDGGRIGTLMNLYPYDQERDGWHFGRST